MKTSYVGGPPPPPWVQLPLRTPLGHLSGISYGIHFGLTPPGYGATDSTSSHVHDIDIDRRNQTNHASSFVLPLGHLLGTSYGITGSTPPWRFWDTAQQIQQEQCGKVQPRFLNCRGLQFEGWLCHCCLCVLHVHNVLPHERLPHSA